MAVGHGVLAVGLGLCFLIASIGLLGTLGAVRFGTSPVGIVLLALGPCLLAAHATRVSRGRAPEPPPSNPEPARPRWEGPVLAAAIGAVVLDRLLRATLIQGHTDPHMTHLLAPRYWLQTASMSIPAFQPGAASAWYWEHLYLWGQWLLGGPDGGGLLEGQIFGQWVHVLFGYVGSLAALRHLGAILGLEPAAAWAMALIGTDSRGLQLIALFAKNDWGAVFFSLALLSAGLDPERPRGPGRSALLGLLAGTAAGVKMNALPYLGVSLLVLHALPAPGSGRWRIRPLETAVSCAVAALAVAPLLARNWVAVGNPLTFALPRWFDTEVWGPSMGAIVKKHTGWWSLDPAAWERQIMSFVLDHPLNRFAVGLPVAALALKRFRAFLAPAAIGWVGLAPFLPRYIPMLMTRWLGLGLVLLPSLVAGLVLLAMQGVPLLRRSWLGLVVALALFGHFNFRGTIGDLGRTGSGVLAARQPDIILGGEAKAWMRLNLPREAPVVTTGDNLLYLVLHHNIRSSRDDLTLIRSLFSVHDPRRVLWVLARQGMRYALDTVHWEAYYWTNAAIAVNALALEHPEALVFAGRGSFILDLDALLPQYFPACFERGPWVPILPGPV